jgi:hypothetical protein
MSLVYCRITTEEVQVLFSIHIPKMNSFTAFQYDRKGMIIVSAKALL